MKTIEDFFKNKTSVHDINATALLKFILNELNLNTITFKDEYKNIKSFFKDKDFISKIKTLLGHEDSKINYDYTSYKYTFNSKFSHKLLFIDKNDNNPDKLIIEIMVNKYNVLKKITLKISKTIFTEYNEKEYIDKAINIDFGNKYFSSVYSDLQLLNFNVFDSKDLNKNDTESPKIVARSPVMNRTKYIPFSSFRELHEKIKKRQPIQDSDLEFIQLTTDIRLPEAYQFLPHYFNQEYFNEMFELRDCLKKLNNQLKNNRIIKATL